MTVDWTISLGSIVTAILTVVGFGIAALGFFYALRSSIDRTGDRLTATNEITNERMLMLSGRMINVENEVKELKDIVVTQAVQDQKLEAHNQRLDQFQKTADEWRSWVRSKIDEIERAIRTRTD